MQVVILAGGLGKRLEALTESLPKPMVPIAGRPILDYQIELAARYGFTNVLMLTGYLSHIIEKRYGNGQGWGVDIRYSVEPEPLSTAGAVRLAHERGLLASEFLLFYGDIVMDVDLEALVAFHRQHGGLVTLVVQPTDHPADSDLIDADPSDSRVRCIHGKPHQVGIEFRNLASAALFVVSADLIPLIPRGMPSDFGRDIFPALARSREPIYAYRTSEYCKDAGTKDRFVRTEKDILSGSVSRRSKRFMRPALLIGRDGVLNADVGVVRAAGQLSVLPGVPAALRRINLSDFLSLVVTNQPAIGKGDLDEAELDRIHARLDKILTEDAGAFVDDLLYCPHHPDVNGPCGCRLPSTGLIEAAIATHKVDRSRSLMIGRHRPEIDAGRAAGLGTIAILPAEAPDLGENFRFPDFASATDFVLGGLCESAGKVDRIVRAASNGRRTGDQLPENQRSGR